jgi:hypothetical protein
VEEEEAVEAASGVLAHWQQHWCQWPQQSRAELCCGTQQEVAAWLQACRMALKKSCGRAVAAWGAVFKHGLALPGRAAMQGAGALYGQSTYCWLTQQVA